MACGARELSALICRDQLTRPSPARHSYPSLVPEVSADDDSIQRFVVRHYRYDPERHERRHVVVAAFDNPTEFEQRIEELAAELELRRASTEPPDPREGISGVVLEPWHRVLQQNAHLLKRAIAHGVVPPNVAELPLPSNVALGWAFLDEQSE